MGLYYLTSDV